MRSVVLSCLPSLLMAQGGFDDLFQKAPPHLDKALRDRLAIFYQAHQDGKFRLADTVVHEDSKEIFFGAEKPRFRGWKIVIVSYEENFTRAKAVIEVDTDFVFPGFGKMQVHQPLSSTWKFDKGEWWWYVVPADCKSSPFGQMCKGPDTPASSGLGLSDIFNSHQMTPDQLRGKIAVDRTEVTLSSHEPSVETVTITNKWENPVNLSLGNTDTPNLGVVLDKTFIDPGESVRMRISYKPTTKVKKPSVSAWVRAEQLATTITFLINFADPPNTQPPPGTKLPISNRAAKPN